MNVLPWLVLLVILAALAASLLWLARRVRRRGGGRELMGPVDLMYRPHAHMLNQEIVIQERRAVDNAGPGDPLKRAARGPAA